MKFLIDMPVTPQVIGLLESAGHEAVHASTVGLGTAPDAAILARARAEGRIVVTADLDFPRLLALEMADGPGLILLRGGSYSDQEMLNLLAPVVAHAAELDIEHSIIVIDQRRVRRRRLPVEP